jgi:hypothetical protein
MYMFLDFGFSGNCLFEQIFLYKGSMIFNGIEMDQSIE